MKASKALVGLAALAQQTRLAVYRLLVEHAPEGFPAGRVAKTPFNDEREVVREKCGQAALRVKAGRTSCCGCLLRIPETAVVRTPVARASHP